MADPCIKIKELKWQMKGTPPKQRLIVIKQGTAAKTKVRGYTKFALRVTAPKEMIELAMKAGLDLYNGMGMGCVETMKN